MSQGVRRPRCSFLALVAVLFLGALFPGAPTHAGPAPRQAGPSLSHVRALFEKEQWPQAVTALKIIVEREPKNANAWFLLGYALHTQGKVKDALPMHIHATELDASFMANAGYNAACAHARLGATEEALEWLARACEAGYDDVEAIRKDPDLESLRDDPRFEAILSKTFVRKTGSVAEAPRPCETQAGRQFDFWIGDWRCTWENGRGTNKVERVLDDCILRESFRAAGSAGETLPLAGLSFSSWSPITQTWSQTWVDNRGTHQAFEGGMRDGAMVLMGELNLGTTTSLSRLTWHDIQADSLQWDYETSADGGETWVGVWHIDYTRLR